MPKLRINRALAAAGVGSRRGVEELIRAGRVRLNGEVVTDLATRVDPERDQLTLDGKPLRLQAARHYYAYHKPRGVISTLRDERGRPCVGDVCRGLEGALRLVGRLDRASEGLLLLTDDGELAQRLTHPRYGVKKVYHVTTVPALSAADAQRLAQGVELDGRPVAVVELELLATEADRARVSLTLAEGRYRVLRHAFAELGYEVRRLKRMRLGTLALGRLKLGETRELSASEVRALRRLVGLAGALED